MVTTSAPSSFQNATTLAVAGVLEEATGVTKQVRPSKRLASPCSHPVFSDPAMGWAPMKWDSPETASWPSLDISPFTLPTSQTTAPGLREEAIRRVRGTIMSTGAAITTRSAPLTASSGVSQVAVHQGCSASESRVSALRAQITIFAAAPRAFAARATEPPRSPGARIVS